MFTSSPPNINGQKLFFKAAVNVKTSVWAGVCYVQQTQVHFIDGILNAQRYRNEILRPIVVPFVHDHYLMLQHDNARPMLQGSVHNSWKLKTSQFLHGQHSYRTCHPLSMFGMLWISIRQRVPVPAKIQQLGTAIEEKRTNIQQLDQHYVK